MYKGINMINNYVYFYHLDKFLIIPMYPDLIADSLSSTFAQTNALSRSAPVFTYSYSGPRSVLITLDLHRDMMNDANLDFNNRIVSYPSDIVYNTDRSDYVDLLINYLQSAALPKYTSYQYSVSSVVPPMIALRFGDTLFIKGVVASSGVQVTYNKPIMQIDDSGRSKYAKATITFSVQEVDPYDAETVAQVGSFRGISSGSTVANYNNDIHSADLSKIIK